ncbi:MAG: hypothetical protein ABEK00_03760 [Candidatus Nanohaloarchaea archaeon]
MSRKGQSAVELTMVIGMAMILASPFIISSQASIIEMRTASQFLELDNSMDAVEDTARGLRSSSYPARRTITFQTPPSVVNVYNPQFSDGSALVFEARYSGSKTNHSIVLDFPLRLNQTGNITKEGIHKLSVKKARRGVNISVIS